MSAASTTEIHTAKASGYLQQLCRHFAHKVPAECDAAAGRISFPLGEVRLAAEGDRLRIALDAPDAERRAALEDVVARHLLRFAFREELRIDWQHPA